MAKNDLSVSSVVFLQVSFFSFRGERDNVSVLPICLNKETMGWRSPTVQYAIRVLGGVI